MTKEGRIYNGNNTSSSIDGVGKTCKRIKLDYCFTLYTKINSKWIKGLKVSTETLKFLEENTGNKLVNIKFQQYLSDLSLQIRETKIKAKRGKKISKSKQMGLY